MPRFMVERYMPQSDLDDLLAVYERMPVPSSKEGPVVRHLLSMWVPEDETCFCLFDAPDVAAVALLNERERVPFLRILGATAFWGPPLHQQLASKGHVVTSGRGGRDG